MNKLKIVTAAFLILSLFIPFSLPHFSRGDEGDYMVSLESPSNEHYTERNVYTFYTIIVANTGTKDDTYDLTNDTIPKYWVGSLDVATVSVPSEESRNITFQIKTTCDCEEGKSAYINITATSQSDSNVTDKIQTITTYADAEVALSSQVSYMDIGAGDSQTIDITVTNECKLEDTFSFTLSYPDEISVEVSPDEVSLPGSGSTTVSLNVFIPNMSEDGLHRVIIKATSWHDASKNDSLVLNVFVVSHEFSISISFSNNRPKEGENTTIFAQIENQGLLDASDVFVRFYYIPKNDTKVPIGSEKVTIEKGNQTTLQKEFTASSGIKEFIVEIDFEGKQENIEQSFTIKEVDFQIMEPDSPLIPILIVLGFILVIIAILIIRSRKGR